MTYPFFNFHCIHNDIVLKNKQKKRQMKSEKKDKDIFAIQTITGLMMVICERVLLFDYSKEKRCWQMMLVDDDKLQCLRHNTTAKEVLDISGMLVQISQECIVNLKYISTIENKTLQCRFHPPYEMIERTASRRYFQKIRERLEII